MAAKVIICSTFMALCFLESSLQSVSTSLRTSSKSCQTNEDCQQEWNGWDTCKKAGENSTGECSCDGIYFEPDTFCFKYASIFHPWCELNEQCSDGEYGKYSLCDSIMKSCLCFDTDGKGREFIYLGGSCSLVRNIGDACRSHEDCFGISGRVECSKSQNICECYGVYVQGSYGSGCSADGLRNTCTTSEQCVKGTFGNLSKCSNAGFCECVDWGYSNKRVKLINKVCQEVDDESALNSVNIGVDSAGPSKSSQMSTLEKGIVISVACLGLITLAVVLFFVLQKKEKQGKRFSNASGAIVSDDIIHFSAQGLRTFGSENEDEANNKMLQKGR